MRAGLAATSTPALERLRVKLAAGQRVSSLTLEADGVPGALAALDLAAQLIVVDSVLAERHGAVHPMVELVWTGPEGRASAARDTAVVLQSLFTRASGRITLAGFRFDSGSELLVELHAAMRDRRVDCQIFGDTGEADEFIRLNWPFGPPFPRVFAFRPTEGVFASLHAKCVVVDGRWSLVTSANFTNRGQTRNVEVGALIEDSAFAHALEQQLHSALALGAFEPI